MSDDELARIAHKGFDDYWTEDCAGSETEAWAASAKAVLASAAQTSPEPVATVMRGGTAVFGRATVLVRWEKGAEALPDGEHKLYHASSPEPVAVYLAAKGVIEASRAVVERWDTPLWKDAAATAVYITQLREALQEYGRQEGDSELQTGHLNADYLKGFADAQALAHPHPPIPEPASTGGIECALNPLLWTREMSDAWHRNLPDTVAAFRALREAATKAEGEA
jgi:hypothetical protein